MLSFFAFLIYLCSRFRHCAYCGELGIKSDMTRDSRGAYFCNTACQVDRAMEAA